MSNSSEDSAEFSEGAANVSITRPHRATPPLNGTFDAEIYGGRAEGNSDGNMLCTTDPRWAFFSILEFCIELYRDIA